MLTLRTNTSRKTKKDRRPKRKPKTANAPSDGPYPQDAPIGHFGDVALSVRSQPRKAQAPRTRSVICLSNPNASDAQHQSPEKHAPQTRSPTRPGPPPHAGPRPSAQNPPYSAALMARDRSSKVSYAGISGCSTLMVTVLRNRKPAFDALIMPRSL